MMANFSYFHTFFHPNSTKSFYGWLPLQRRDIGAKDNHDSVQTLKEIINTYLECKGIWQATKAFEKNLAKLQGSPWTHKERNFTLFEALNT
jgi:hypothetical protein